MAISPYGIFFQPQDANGTPYPGALMYCLASGTTWPGGSQVAYSDAACATPLANPVVADASGVFPAMYLSDSESYKFQITDAAGNVLRTDDNVAGSTGAVSASGSTSTPAVTGTNIGAGAGVYGKNTGTGYGVIAEAPATTPTKAALRIVPQNSAPSSPVKGDIYIDATTGLMVGYDGSINRRYLAANAAGHAIAPGSVNPVGAPGSRQILTVGSGTYTTPTGATALLVRGWGGGGAGGGTADSTGAGNADVGTGGNAGGYSELLIVPPSPTYSYVVGAGGTGSAGNNGGDGAASTFGASLTAVGGKGGLHTGSITSAGVLNPLTTVVGSAAGDITGNGDLGFPAVNLSGVGTGPGGNGASSLVGTGGAGALYTNGAGSNASGYAAGGGGAKNHNNATTYAGGNGTPGVIEIIEFF